MVLENGDLYWLTGLVTFSFHVVFTQFVLLSVINSVYYYFCYDCFPHYIKSIVKCWVNQVNFLSIVYETFCPAFDFLSHSSVIVVHLFSTFFIVGISRKQGAYRTPLVKTGFEPVQLFRIPYFPLSIESIFWRQFAFKKEQFQKVWFSTSRFTAILNLTDYTELCIFFKW